MIRTVNSIFFVVGLRKCKLIVTLFCRQQLQRIQSPGHDCRGPQALQTLLWQVWITKTPYPHPTPLGPGSCLPTGGGKGGCTFILWLRPWYTLQYCTRASPLGTPLVHCTVMNTLTLVLPPPPTSLLSFSTGGNPLWNLLSFQGWESTTLWSLSWRTRMKGGSSRSWTEFWRFVLKIFCSAYPVPDPIFSTHVCQRMYILGMWIRIWCRFASLIARITEGRNFACYVISVLRIRNTSFGSDVGSGYEQGAQKFRILPDPQHCYFM
jgi:hypothetical protein